MSIYEKFKTTCRVKYDNVLSDSFVCSLGVRERVGHLFFFSIYLNNIEDYFMTNGVDMGMLKLFVLLYADDIVIIIESETGLLGCYCDRWKLQVNIMIFKKDGMHGRNLSFTYKHEKLEIVKYV